MTKFFQKIRKIGIFAIILGLLWQSSALTNILNIDHVKAASENITQINFTTEVQTVETNTSSARITTQTQNAEGTSETVSETTTLNLSSNSPTGEFSSNGTDWFSTPTTLTMNTGTANRNFYYKDSTVGTHTLTVNAEGQDWTPATQDINIVDTIAPVLDITAPSTSEEVNGDKIITFTDSEETNPQCSIDNTNWVDCTSGTTTLSDITGFDALEEGDFTLYLKDTDNAGNTGTDNETGIIKDSVAPVVTGVTNNKHYNKNVTPTFNNGTATLSKDSGDAEDFTSGTEISNEGEYQLVVTDNAGNVTTVNFIIDTTAPTGSIKINNNTRVTNSRKVTLNLNYTDINIDKMRISNNSGFKATCIENDWQNVKTSITDWQLTEGNGQKTVYVQFKDKAGNTSKVYEALIYYNNKAENIETTKIKGTNSYTKGNIYLMYSAGQERTLTYAEYTSNPEGSTNFSAFGKYFDLSLDNKTGVSGLVLYVYYTQADLDAAGITEKQITGLYYWNDIISEWEIYPNQEVNTQNKKALL